MKPVDQTTFGEEGNCFAACVASILELPIEEVPNFCVAYPHDTWFEEFNRWLEPRGLACVSMQADVVDVEAFCASAPRIPLIVDGRSPRGRRHGVVYVDGKLAHDPHPSRDGIIENTIRKFWLLLSEVPR